MRKTIRSFSFFNRGILVLLGVVLCTAVFGIVAWQTGSASGKSDSSGLSPKNEVRAPAVQKRDPLVPENFDCATISEKGIDRQENLRAGAIMISCGLAQGGVEMDADGGQDDFTKQLMRLPAAFGASDVDLITGTETAPNITQSETFTTANPDNPLQVISAYNDSRGRNATPINISGASVSTDGGTTFTRLTAASGQSPFPNTFGDPVVLYNRSTATWYTVWLDAACGTQGLGGFKSTTPSDPSPAPAV